MQRSSVLGGAALAAFLAALLLGGRDRTSAATAPASFPRPAFDDSVGETAVFAGGCFWGIEAVFEHVKGVTNVVSGYAGGSVNAPTYEQVSSGATGHAEAVRVTFDPSHVSYGQLLEIFFSVAHDPTQLDRQGPDVGTQYRSAIFYQTEDQKRISEAYIAQLGQVKAFRRPIVTQVAPLREFYLAEPYHQDYAAHHPNQPYIVIHDAPKVDHLRQRFPQLYRVPPKS